MQPAWCLVAIHPQSLLVGVCVCVSQKHPKFRLQPEFKDGGQQLAAPSWGRTPALGLFLRLQRCLSPAFSAEEEKMELFLAEGVAAVVCSVPVQSCKKKHIGHWEDFARARRFTETAAGLELPE